MAKTEAAKALEAKQKEAVRAEKARKKNSDDPRDWGTIRQLREVYKLVASQDKKFPPLLFGALLGPFILLLVIGLVLLGMGKLAWFNVILLAVMGIAVGVLLATLLMNRRAKSAMLNRVEGQAGSGEVALQMLGKEWSHTPAIAYTRQMDVVHRAIGPGGLFLVGEGNPGRVRQLLAQETKRHETALYGIKAKTVMVGDADGQVALKDLTKYLQKQPKTLDEAKITEAKKRFTALDAMRRKMSVPQGPMPTRAGSKQALRGR